MGSDDQGYSKKDKNGNINYSKKAPHKNRDDFVNESYKSSFNTGMLNARYGIEKQKKELKHLKIPYSKIITVLVIVLVAWVIGSYGDHTLPSIHINENIMGTSPDMIPVKASGEPVSLINNESAVNPTWDELISFLKADDTDRILYQNDRYICSDFAERLHNNAERAGIRASFVTVDFYDNDSRHALNAFETTDKGLTYVDCTGSDVELQELDSFDKIAYIEKGKKYGIISIYYTNTPEYGFYNSRKNHLRLRGFYEDMGYVKNVNVYWESV
jgi:hypothetical protein